MKVGIIGYGSMGRMLLEKLSKNKDTSLFVYNRTREKLNVLAPEITICSSNSDLASKVDIVIIVLLISNRCLKKLLIQRAMRR